MLWRLDEAGVDRFAAGILQFGVRGAHRFSFRLGQTAIGPASRTEEADWINTALARVIESAVYAKASYS